MSRLVVNLDALHHNVSSVKRWMDVHKARWIAVTKALCGHEGLLHAMELMGVPAIGDSRLANLEVAGRVIPHIERWYLRGPLPSVADEVVLQSEVSLNSEIQTIEMLNAAGRRHNRQHGVIIMIELGDLREGILPGSLVKFYENVFELPYIRVLGIGANLGCLAGAMPTVDQLMQLVLYRELLELKFQHGLPLISAGTTATLPLLLNGHLPEPVNHFRIGEALLLGTDLITGGQLPYLRGDVFTLEAEISEIKEKSLTPMGELSSFPRMGDAADDEPATPGQRGYRAVVNVGQVDTDISGLTPVDPRQRIAGGSSDVTVVSLGEETGGLRVGDRILFKVNYGALVRLMSSRYTDKIFIPDLEDFASRFISQEMSEKLRREMAEPLAEPLGEQLMEPAK